MNRAIKENSIDGESVIPEVIEDTLDDAFSLTVQFSPSGVLIATGCNDGKILVYDRTSRLYGRALMGHSGPVMCVSWLSDLCLVSGGADGTVCVWQNDGESEETRRQPTIRLCYGAPVLSISAATTGLQIIVNCLGMMPIINEIGTASPRVWQLPITPTDRVVEAFVSPTCTDTDTDARTTTGNTGKMYCEAVGTVLATDHIASTETTGKTGTKTDTQAEADMGRSTRTEMPTHIEAAINTDVIANTTTHADGEKRTCTGMHTSAATSTDTDNTANTGTYTTTDTNRNARTGSSTNPGTQTSANLNTNNTHPFGAASVGMRGRVPDSSGGFLSQEMYQRRHINLEQYMTVHEQPQTKNARHGHGAACKSTCVHTRTLTPTTEDTQTYNNTAIYSTASGHVVYVATFEGRIMQVNLRTERVMLSVSLNKAAVAIRTIQCSKDGTLLLVTCSLRSLFLLNTSTMTVIDELKEAIDAQIWHCAILSPCNQYIVAAKTPGNMPMHK
ncbi:hypothetical protein SARC_05371 [Sphaeroforma arctica JP610]|uniref:Uncharacterized protein n=1 Tax=Sphaeroforma arctica JP610 TaxID=667725 RepID=A0A0L0FZQ2_9EUKA|nr:hypothetical protein SARC_05371 [Sphaeroforma arctica JP610]KNC82332.1 hypothetical protein SARC_05371 [Sphaeroforma arctica JP610]|eukprot:XP_014156234.1 hypothetical protein SARC_05371 [Sphaeroforma arctica JP610]